MNNNYTFYYNIMAELLKLTKKEGSFDSEIIDKKAFDIAKKAVKFYEEKMTENAGGTFQKDGILFPNFDGTRHFVCLKVTFEKVENIKTDGGIPGKKFHFTIIEGPYAGFNIIHKSVHTPGFSKILKTEENFVKNLKYEGPYDAKESLDIKEYNIAINDKLPHRYIYEVNFYPVEGRYTTSKIKIISATPTAPTGDDV